MKLQRKRNLTILIPIASMGDIAFLLIIFFMLASNMVKEAHLELKPPESPDIEEQEQQPISVAIDKEGTVYLNGEECPTAAMEGMVSDLLSRRKEKTVLVKIDEGVTEDIFGPLLLALSRAQAEPILTGIQHKK